MDYWQRSRGTLLAVAGFGTGFAIWTLLLGALAPVDAWWQAAPPAQHSSTGQIAQALSLLTLPMVVYPILLILAAWAARRQLTTLAAALVLSVALSFGAAALSRELIARPRPESEWAWLIAQHGYSYPAAHVVAATAAAVMAFTVVATVRRRSMSVLVARLGGVLIVTLVATVQLMLGAHRITDLVGGILLGGFTVSLANLICAVHKPHGRPVHAPSSQQPRGAFIYNPTKVVDQTVFKSFIERRFNEEGWQPPVWLSTTVDDPGRAMARTALDSEVDMVFVAGGDGTVRVVCGALAGTGTPLTIVPSGTGNLLARNLGIPVDVDQALSVAFDGQTQEIDLLQVRSPGKDDDHAAVMCGIAADANLMNDTDESLKKSIGVGAYVVAGLKHAQARPVTTTVTIDDAQPMVREATITMVCNVSDLQAGLTLMPEASPTDGQLDVLVASPQNQTEVNALISAVVTQGAEPDTLERFTGRRVRVEVASSQLYEFDGDVIGEATRLDFEILPAALRVRVPR